MLFRSDVCHVVDTAKYRARHHEPGAHDPATRASGARAEHGVARQVPSRITLDQQQDARLEDIAHLVERSVDEVRDILGMAEPVSSLDVPLPSDSHSTLLDLIADADAETPDLHVEQQELSQMVRRWIDAMPIKHRMVILRRFGLDHAVPATLDELADELGVTRERVRQIQQDGLLRLKQLIAMRGVAKDALL